MHFRNIWDVPRCAPIQGPGRSTTLQIGALLLSASLAGCGGGSGGGGDGAGGGDAANLRDHAFSAAYTALLHYFNDPAYFSAAYTNLTILDDGTSTPDVAIDCPSGSADVSDNSFATRNANGDLTSITLRANLGACRLNDSSLLGNAVLETGGLNFQMLVNGNTTTYGFVLASAYDTNSGEHRIDFRDNAGANTGYEYFDGQVSWSMTPASNYVDYVKQVAGSMRAGGPDEDLGSGALSYDIQSKVNIRVDHSGGFETVTYTAGNPEGSITYSDGEACILDGQFFPATQEPVVLNFVGEEVSASAGAMQMRMFIDESSYGEMIADVSFAGDTISVTVGNRANTVGPATYHFPLDGIMEIPGACSSSQKALRRSINLKRPLRFARERMEASAGPR